eukprot:jgi/Psemu1/68750/estExt_Genemark1.C_5850016
MNNNNESRQRRKRGFRGEAIQSNHYNNSNSNKNSNSNSNKNNDEEAGTTVTGDEHRDAKILANRYRSIRIRIRIPIRNERNLLWKVVTVVVVFVIWIVYQCQDYFDERLQDKCWRGMLLLPLRYLRVKWIDQRPTGVRKFTLRHGRSFVINLDVDKERWNDFQDSNRKQLPNISRFPATSLQTKIDDKREHYYLEEYRFLPKLIENEGKGSAACAISHLKLLAEFVANATDDDDYIFVFEDDAVLTPQLLQGGFVVGPDNADFILLTEYSSAHIRVPFDRTRHTTATRNLNLNLNLNHLGDDVYTNKTMEENYAESINSAVRVVSGYSAMGYVITRRAARIVLEEMKDESHLPVDVYYFANPDIKAYLPLLGWPLVQHNRPYLSVRRDKNMAR